MNKLLVPALIALLVPAAGAKVWTTPYRCDETTPLALLDPNYPTIYRDIMVGTRLALIVSSDKGEYWLGRLLMLQDDTKYATLSGRGYTTTQPGSTVFYPNYKDSCLQAAGGNARVRDVKDLNGTGFSLTTATPLSIPTTVAGDWFVIDYRAEQVGVCNIGLCDSRISNSIPIQVLSFLHVPSRDFNGDAVVDFQDFALLASHWGSVRGSDPNDPAAGFDLNDDARIDLGDLALFGEYWLQRTDCGVPGREPNDVPAGNL
jgi:hypothetical protein